MSDLELEVIRKAIDLVQARKIIAPLLKEWAEFENAVNLLIARTLFVHILCSRCSNSIKIEKKVPQTITCDSCGHKFELREPSNA